MGYPESDKNKYAFQKLVGIDAAASEFDAPPEVFAPAFRKLQEGFSHFTFHAGEDFFHPVSGLRAIYEAIEFLDLKENDRIGHATALGISPELWKERIGESIYICQGEWLDNLLFAHELLDYKSDYFGLREEIEGNIKKIAKTIYEETCEEYDVQNLKEAWKARKWCPMLLLSSSYVDAQRFNFNEKEWIAIQEWKKNTENYDNIENIIRKYHSACRKRYEKKINIDLLLINEDLIKSLQKKLISIIKAKKIIIETLPTSNVRIGVYKSHKEHHLKNWLPEGLQVVVGSDDPGIFATNIYNEYAHIYQMFNEEGSEKQRKIIDELIKNSKKYLFKDSTN
jgi:hypothetical protein